MNLQHSAGTGRLTRCLKALAAASGLAALLVGVPWGLVHFVGWPLPTRVPTLNELGVFLTSQLSTEVLVNVLACVVWLAWANFALDVAVEALAAARGITPPRLPSPTQAVAAALVGAVLAGILSTTARGATAATGAGIEQPRPAATALHAPQQMEDRATSAAAHPEVALHTAAASGVGTNPTGFGTTWRDADAPDAATYQVRHGDSLWAIAERQLGDPWRWREIYTINRGVHQPSGGALTDPDVIEPGWILRLPQLSPQQGASQPGHGGNLTADRPTHTVKAGDTLWDIADARLGDPHRWGEIHRLNRDRHDMRGGRHIEPGWVLTLPTARPHSPDPRPPSSPPTAEPPSTDPGTEHSPDRPGPSPSSSVAPSPSQSLKPDPDGVVPPPTTPSAPSTPASTGSSQTSPSSAAPATDHTRPDNANPDDGVDLPGGWIGLPFAAALLAAAALVWRRRRHRYTAATADDRLGNDPDLAPLPPLVTRLGHAVRHQAPELLNPPDTPRPTVADHAIDTRSPLPPIGPSGPELAGLHEQIPTGGLGLTGPGAEPAARALLAATLSTGSPNDPDARGQVVIPADALATLLGADAVDVGPIPRLTVTATLTQALTHVEELLIQRRRLLQEHDANDLAGMRATDVYHPPMPPVLLLAETPPDELLPRLSTSLNLGAPLQICAVVLGDLPNAESLTVAEDGHTPDGRRLAVLDIPGAVQLLQVLREAHTGQTASVAPAEPTPPADSPLLAPQPAPASGSTSTDTVRPLDADEESTIPPSVAPSGQASGAAPADERAWNARSAPALAGPSPISPVRVRLLGEPGILHRDGTLVPGLRHHARELLVYLAVHRDGADLPDVMEAFWPTATLRRAAQRLSTEVGNLRRTIRQAAGDDTIQPVVNTGGRYHLAADLLDLDVWRIVDALRQARDDDDPARRVAALQRAVDAHAGTLAEGHDYDWIEPYREQVRRHGILARVRLSELIADDPRRAAELAHAATELDPYSDDLARRAMHTHARLGDATAIRARLQRLRDALTEIDEEPAAETIACAAQLQRESTSHTRRNRSAGASRRVVLGGGDRPAPSGVEGA